MKNLTETPPYAAPSEWYARHIAHRLGIMPAPLSETRRLNRCTIATLTSPRTLTIPVSGGSAMLKNCKRLNEIEVSDHGDWRRVHWGAITTAYHRTPFFIHYAHLFEPVYCLENPTLLQFCNNFHQAVSKALDTDRLLPFLPGLLEGKKLNDRVEMPHYRQIHPLDDPGLSILDALFNLGPETIIMLCRALYS